MKRFVQILVCCMVMLVAGMASADEHGHSVKGEPLFYNVRTTPGEYLQIALLGDGDGDIDCYLYDKDDNLVGKDNDRQDNCSIQGTVTGSRYKLKVVNSSDSSSLFVLRVKHTPPAKDI